MRKTFAIGQIVLLLLLWNVPLLNLRQASADDIDIFSYNIQPNVVFALTSSTNMNNQIRSEVYNPGTAYNTPLTYTTTTVYKWLNSTPGCKPLPKPCYTVYAASISAVSDTSAQTALQTVGYWTGSISGSQVSLYYGNYLNYTLCSTCGTMQTKISIAKTVMTDVINNTQGLRFGATKYGAAAVLFSNQSWT
jgi:hypothetical protein